MNFFEAQAKAKRHTFFFLVLFGVALAGLVLLSTVSLLIGLRTLETATLQEAFFTFMEASTPQIWLFTSGLILLVVGSGTLYMTHQLSKGGSFVAEALGGRRVNTNTRDTQEKQLLNVVQEISIASGISVPPVYILDEVGINAFAAGQSTDDAVIGVTQGLLDFLNRDEIQGVIAHEFSHIFNGDMRMNMKLTGSLHGILLIGLIGEGILRTLLRGNRSFSSSSGRSSRSKKEGGSIVVLALAAAFYIIGLLGKLVGGLIKATISRNREYLADATAVQYTRYPQGIAGALKKIGALTQGSQLEAPQASTFSHLYFSNGLSGFFSEIFATHPPLEKRILALEPNWNRRYPKLSFQAKKEQTRSVQADAFREKRALSTSATVAAKMASIGQAEEVHIKYAQKLRDSLPDAVRDKIEDSLGAQALILALLAASDEVLRHKQENILSRSILLEFKQALALVSELNREAYLSLIKLAMPALKTSSLQQYKNFRSYLIHFIESDNRVTLFEWSLQHSVLRPLDRVFGLKMELKMVHSSLFELQEEIEILFSMLAQSQYQKESDAKAAFEHIRKEQGWTPLKYRPKKEIDFVKFTQSIALLETAHIPIKREIMEAVLLMMMADKKLSVIEYEMIHALAEILQVPLPPLRA